jgi:IS30 family transposase
MASSGAAPALGLLSASRESWRRLGRMSAVRPPGIPAVRRQATRSKPAKLATNQRLNAEVQSKLIARLSPEQVTAYLHREFPDDPGMWESPETIYQSIYVQGRGALRRELALCLRTGRACASADAEPPSAAVVSRHGQDVDVGEGRVVDAQARTGHVVKA